MENLWALVLLTISLAVAGEHLLLRWRRRRLPPGPAYFPVVGNLLWLRNSVHNLEPLIRRLRLRYGPIITLHIGSRPVIFVTDRSSAHKFLIQHGANFADRPPPLESLRLLTNNQHNINNAAYGPTWRLLRRNLMSEILNPSRVKLYSYGRKWVLGVLLEKIKLQAEEKHGEVVVKDAFQYAMFCLLVLMCFGEKLEEEKIREIERAQRDLLLYFRKLQVFAFFPRIAKFVFAERWKKMMELRERQMDVFLPLITSRRERRKDHERLHGGDDSFCYSYADSLFDIEWPEEDDEAGRKLTGKEIAGLCSEFLNAGTDTTSTALQWIMANFVKHQHVQARLVEEIDGVVPPGAEIEEEDLHKMPYLKAVIMEGLRRHPPAHFVLPHAVTEDVTVDGYEIPKDATINFTVAEMGWDRKMWEEPLEFKPERFLPGGEGEGVDITGSREIKMMPFGVGRRICPGLGLALLHLEYFVANLVRTFHWKPIDGRDVDLSEKNEFTVVMKNPLRALVSSRI